MGCSNQLDELEEFDYPIRKFNTGYKFTNNHLKDLLITLNNILKIIESYRKILIDKREKIVYLTGCCCLNKQTLENCLICLFKSLAITTKGDISNYKDIMNKDFDISLPIYFGDVDCLLKEYLEDMKNIIGNFDKTIENFELSYKGINESSSKIISEITEEKFENEMKKMKVVKNKVIPMLKARFIQDSNFSEVVDRFFDKHLVDKYNDIWKKNEKNNFSSQFEIVYKLADVKDKYGNCYERGRDTFKNKIQIKSEFVKTKSVIVLN